MIDNQVIPITRRSGVRVPPLQLKLLSMARTTKKMGRVAGKALRSKKTSKTTKRLAGCALRQRRKK